MTRKSPCGSSTCLTFFFFKQKTAYELRISDWSSDVCSSDLDGKGEPAAHGLTGLRREHRRHFFPYLVDRLERPHHDLEIPYLSVGVPADDVDAIDLDAVELADEFEAGLIAVDDLAQIAKTVAAEDVARRVRSEEHTSEIQSLMRISYAVFCL